MESKSLNQEAKRADAINQLRECGRLFYQRGWSVGTSSNYSCVLSDDPFRVLITASGYDKGRLENYHFVVVDEKGSLVEVPQTEPPRKMRASAETMLHIVAARHFGARSVLHTHSIWGTLLSEFHAAESGFCIEGYEMLKGFSGISTHETRKWIPIFENTQNIPALAVEVERMMEKDPELIQHGFLIRKHGLYTWGESVDDARRHIEIFEFLFECEGRRLSLPVESFSTHQG